MITPEGLEQPELDALIDRLDKRYCHPATAAAVDPDVEVALRHIEAVRNACETAYGEATAAEVKLDEIRAAAETMRRMGEHDDNISDETAELLITFADRLFEALDNDN